MGLSEQSSWYSGSAQASELKGKYSFYYYTLSTYKGTNTVEHALATGQPNSAGSTSHTGYWLASRCMKLDSTWFDFNMFYVSNDAVNAEFLYRSIGVVDSTGGYVLRPVIEIDLTRTNIGETGSGESTSPYSIAAR